MDPLTIRQILDRETSLTFTGLLLLVRTERVGDGGVVVRVTDFTPQESNY